MSTFNGIISEFPGIRVDFFRGVVDDPPMACFLSHIHSDHLAGLDTYKGRPIYCSAATRAMLLKLQRKASRINFAQGVLEVEDVTYKHQKNRLKPLPLNTQTEIELGPNNKISVTLLDANHCPGAVMFLFEGNGKAVLYTGDIRSEPTHVDNLLRNPSLVEYSLRRNKTQLKCLDKIYLDTSFTEDIHFQTKADGLHELLAKVAKYPDDTVFYFSAWTYGYEEVWIALSKALHSQIHVDDYKMSVYESLRLKFEDDYVHLSPEAAALVGFSCGNRPHPGCLTRDPNVRLHSCEKGSGCPKMQNMATGDVVWITPIVAHLRDDNDLVEIGIGGGADDLEERERAVLSTGDLCMWLKRAREDREIPKDTRVLLQNFLTSAISAQHPLVLSLINEGGPGGEQALEKVYKSLVAAAVEDRGLRTSTPLTNRVSFPYSRHSSYGELCHLVSELRPKDVWPCTVDPVRWIKNDITIEGLFGEHCSGDVFDHDMHMAQLAGELHIEDMGEHDTQTSAEFHVQSLPAPGTSPSAVGGKAHEVAHKPDKALISQSPTTTCILSDECHEPRGDHDGEDRTGGLQVIDLTAEASDDSQGTDFQFDRPGSLKRDFNSFIESAGSAEKTGQQGDFSDESGSNLLGSQESSISSSGLETRRAAFNLMLQESSTARWSGLLCTTNNHSHVEYELGED